MLENTEGPTKYGQSRETGDIGGRQKNTNRTRYNIGHHYTQTNTNNVNKTRLEVKTNTHRFHAKIVANTTTRNLVINLVFNIQCIYYFLS